MSTPLTLSGYATAVGDKERGHRLRWRLACLSAILLTVGLAVYGSDYYLLGPAARALSPKHDLLKPGGTIGLKLGMLGVGLFLIIFLYPLRKRVQWLAKRGSSKHWLDFHIVVGLTAPVVIAFHASFKFGGIAGMAFWIMVAVALSGIIGRYIYNQIPRSLNSAVVSLKELHQEQEKLSRELGEQSVLRPSDLDAMFAMPTADEVRNMPAYRALLLMMALDVARPFHAARLRARVLGWGELAVCGFGLFSSSRQDLESIVRTARRRSALGKRILFLDRSHKIFHLWHVIHRPFSYSFAVLALLHIAVVWTLGFF